MRFLWISFTHESLQFDTGILGHGSNLKFPQWPLDHPFFVFENLVVTLPITKALPPLTFHFHAFPTRPASHASPTRHADWLVNFFLPFTERFLFIILTIVDTWMNVFSYDLCHSIWSLLFEIFKVILTWGSEYWRPYCLVFSCVAIIDNPSRISYSSDIFGTLPDRFLHDVWH